MKCRQLFNGALTIGGIALPLLIPPLALTGLINYFVGYRIFRLPEVEHTVGFLPVLICFGAAFLAGLLVWFAPRIAAGIYVVGGVLALPILGRYLVFHYGIGFVMPILMIALGVAVFSLAEKEISFAATKRWIILCTILFAVSLTAALAHGVFVVPERNWHSQFFADICDLHFRQKAKALSERNVLLRTLGGGAASDSF